MAKHSRVAEAFYATYETGLIGPLTLVSDGEALTGCWFEHDRHYSVEGREGELTRDDRLAAFAPAREWLGRYFAGERPAPEGLPLREEGTDFQRAVWEELARIPYGEVTTYGAVARSLEARLGKRQSSRAVGGAVGRNKLGILVPCHRVVGSDGSLTGFGGGIAVKQRLLEFEGVDMSGFYVPKRGTAL